MRSVRDTQRGRESQAHHMNTIMQWFEAPSNHNMPTLLLKQTSSTSPRNLESQVAEWKVPNPAPNANTWRNWPCQQDEVAPQQDLNPNGYKRA